MHPQPRRPTASMAASKEVSLMRPPHGVLHPALEFLVEDRHGPVRTGSDEVHEDDQRGGAIILGRQAEKLGLVQPGEEKTPVRPYCLAIRDLVRKAEIFLLMPVALDFKVKESR